MIVEIVVVTLITLSSPVVAMVFIRVVESESLKVGKSVNNGKNIAKGTTDPGVDCFDQ